MLPQYRRSAAVLLAAALAAGFILLIPAYCQGFPEPVVSEVRLSGAPSPQGGELYFLIDSVITNEGTGGNVVVTTRLVNTSRDSVEGSSRTEIYMTAQEVRALRTRVGGPSGTPFLITVTAERRSAFNRGS
jgi:hypothetical protein